MRVKEAAQIVPALRDGRIVARRRWYDRMRFEWSGRADKYAGRFPRSIWYYPVRATERTKDQKSEDCEDDQVPSGSAWQLLAVESTTDKFLSVRITFEHPLQSPKHTSIEGRLRRGVRIVSSVRMWVNLDVWRLVT